ncbi:MAG: hypothetical protein NT062_37995, partial [Proteobacteria bacterium]|nr:hypothetical protein [Pseudomonadota bacterium]
MSVPVEISGIGSTAQKLRVTPGFDPLKAGVGPEEYFVLSRIDGTQSIKDVLLTTGLPTDRAVQIVTRLRAIGALMLPNETSPPPVQTPVAVQRISTPQTQRTAPPATASTSPHRPPPPVLARTMTPLHRPAVGTVTEPTLEASER